MKNIKQIHSGSGDNIIGNKIISKPTKNSDGALPLWAQWVAWVSGFFLIFWSMLEH